MVGQNVEDRNCVIGHLVGPRVENLDHAVRAFAPAQRHGNHRAHPARFGGILILDPRIARSLGNNERFAVLCHPAGYALAHFHTKVAQRSLFATRGNSVVQVLLLLVEHEERPQFRLDDPFHLLEDCAQNGVQIKAGSQRTRQLVEDQQIRQGYAAFCPVLHFLTMGQSLSSILSQGVLSLALKKRHHCYVWLEILQLNHLPDNG